MQIKTSLTIKDIFDDLFLGELITIYENGELYDSYISSWEIQTSPNLSLLLKTHILQKNDQIIDLKEPITVIRVGLNPMRSTPIKFSDDNYDFIFDQALYDTFLDKTLILKSAYIIKGFRFTVFNNTVYIDFKVNDPAMSSSFMYKINEPINLGYEKFNIEEFI